MANAYSTVGTVLQLNTAAVGSSPTWADFVPIKSFSGFSQEAGTIDVTDLSAEEFTQNVKGLKDLDNLTFEVNVNSEIITIINALKNRILDMRIYFKQNGIYQRFTGELSFSISDGGVNEAMTGVLTVTPMTMGEINVAALPAITITTPETSTAVIGVETTITPLTTDPEDATITAQSDDLSKLSVIVQDGVVKYTGLEIGVVTLTIRAMKLGNATAEKVVTVTITAE